MAEQLFTLAGNQASFADTGHTYVFGPPKNGKRPLSVVIEGSVKLRDTVNLDSLPDRQRFVCALNGHGDIVADELVALSVALAKPADGADDEQGKSSQASTMVALVKATGVVLFHDTNGDTYGRIPVGDHLETWVLRSKGFRQFIANLYYVTYGSAPGGQATQDALNVLAGEALFSRLQVQVWTRIAFHEEAIYLDLADEHWRAVKITDAGWELCASRDVPVMFVRPKGMSALPEPVRGGSLLDVRHFLGFDEDSDELALIVGWLLGVFQRQGGRVLLELIGQQGSGKSTTAHMLIKFIDPCTVALRRPPREEGDLLIAAKNRGIVAFDNLSKLDDWLSDALCRLSTGGGLGKRELYTDSDETLLDAQRPVILTGINGVVQNSDLLDRSIRVSLEPIEDEDRMTESAVWATFHHLHGSALGGLLDAVSAGLRELPNVQLDHKPRMADFAEWVEACSSALNWQPGDFLRVFEVNRGGSNMIAIEALAVGPAIIDLMTKQETWIGTATDLLDKLGTMVSDGLKREKEWPKKANTLSRQLKKLSPNLAKVGVWIGWDQSPTTRVKSITLERNPNWETYQNSGPKKKQRQSSLESFASISESQKQAELRVISANDTDDALSLDDRSELLDLSLESLDDDDGVSF